MLNIGGNHKILAMTELIKIWFKELKNLFSDAGTIMLFMIAIIIYPILYSLAYNNELAKDIPIAIVDENRSDLSRKLVQMIDASDEIKVAYHNSDFHTAEKLFDEGKIYGIIHILDDFNIKILRFETAHVSVYADATYMVIYKQILTGASYSIGTMSAGVEIQRRMAQGQAMEVAYYERDPLPLEIYTLYNPKGGYGTYVLPAVLLLILQQTLLLGIGLLGGTYTEKGIAHYLVPVGLKKGGAISIIIAKSLAYFTLYLVNALFVLVVIFRIFSLPMRGSYFEVFIFIIPFLFSVIYMGLSIAALFKSRESSLLILLFTSIPFIFLSGFSWPVQSMPVWQQYFSEIIPSTPAIKGFLALSQKGAHFSTVFNHWQHLWLLSLIYLIIASLLMKKNIQKAKKAYPELYK